MTPCRRAALAVEMAEGRLQQLRQSERPDPDEVEAATMTLEGARSTFHMALEAATGCDTRTLARTLTL